MSLTPDLTPAYSALTDRLAQMVSHDMNNLLTVIGGNVDWLARHGNLDSSGDERIVQNTLSAIRQGSELMQSFEAFARSRRDPETVVLFDDVMTHTLRLARRLVPRTILIAYEPESGPACTLRLSSRALHFLLSWILNVSQTLEKGHVRVRAALSEPHRSTSPGPKLGAPSWLRIRIICEGDAKDLGGVETFLSSLELPQTSVDEDATRIGAKTADEQAYVTVSSEDASSVDLYLPCVMAAEETLDAGDLAHGKRIVVVDDEVLITQFLRQLLETHGYRVHVLHNGASFIDCVHDAEYAMDLAVIDGRLPDMSGVDCVQVLRQVRGMVPAIIISGSGDAGHEICTEADAYLEKPFSTAQLLQAIRGGLCTSHAHDSE